MLTANFKEKDTDVIEISGLESASVLKIVDFFYSGILHVDPLNVCSILAVADLFLLEQTKTSLIRYLLQIINSGNCVLVKHLGDMYADPNLSKSSERFLRRNFEDVIETEGFLELRWEELDKILDGGAIFVKTEERILQAVVR